MAVNSSDLEILKSFLSFPLNSTTEIFAKFKELPGSIHKKNPEISQEEFVYIPGKRKDRVLLVAHADTVWHGYSDESSKQTITVVKSPAGKHLVQRSNHNVGIGADDRAGCAILWLLKDSGHSLLILDGEEGGRIGSNFLANDFPELFDEINQHQFALQFDRRNAQDYKVYKLPVTEDFHQFIQDQTGFKDAGKSASTDICTLCRDICGANLSIGYFNEHNPDEDIIINDWQNTLNISRKILKENCPKFPLQK